jgi:hypothetical protein
MVNGDTIDSDLPPAARDQVPIHRDPTGDTLNRIVNHPEVRPWLMSEDQELDFRLLANDPRIFLLVGDPPIGSIVFGQVVTGVYEAHAAVLPEGRGVWMTQLSEAAIRYMFTATDCIEILTRVLQGHVAAVALARYLGFVERWRCPAFRFRGRDVPYGVWGLTMMDWFPADDDGRKAALQEMYHAGQGEKAKSWYARWTHLSRNTMVA